MKRIDILVPGDKLREVREAIKKSGAGGVKSPWFFVRLKHFQDLA